MSSYRKDARWEIAERFAMALELEFYALEWDKKNHLLAIADEAFGVFEIEDSVLERWARERIDGN